MKRPRAPKDVDANGLTTDDRRIWGRVSGSVTPPRVRKAARVAIEGPAHTPEAIQPAPPRTPPRPGVKRTPTPVLVDARAPTRGKSAPEDVEPNRKRRLTRERDPIEARIDLHGFGRFEAEDQLRGFLTSCQARGMRAVLVITGQGRLGGGVIRASFADWMHSPELRAVVSGYTTSHQRHGGDGAFYVTLRRKA